MECFSFFSYICWLAPLKPDNEKRSRLFFHSIEKKRFHFFRADEKGRLSHNRSDPGGIVGSAPTAAAALLSPRRMDPGSGADGVAVLPRLLGQIGILRFSGAVRF